MRRFTLASVPVLLLATLAATPAPERAAPMPWGAEGHAMAARAAVAGLPGEVPVFFRDAGPRLAWLNPEPDRWRSRVLEEMNEAWAYDHYVDLENVPEGALDAVDRFEFLRALYEAGLEVPERDAGFLPYRILELYQRLVTEWRMWRDAAGEERRWIEERIVNDAGILGHYVTDASQPHHTTIHFNGWNEEAPNPRGFTKARDFHGRFEADFVRAHLTQADVDRRTAAGARSVAGAARSAIWAFIRETHGQVDPLYELEQEHGFDPDAPAAPETEEFTARRLAAGADMLRTLWWSAWVESAEPEAGG